MRHALVGDHDMEDWQQRLEALDGRLLVWTRAYEGELERVCKERRLIGWFRKPTQIELDSAAIEARRRAGVDILAEVAAFCDDLCDFYPKCLPQERCKIRAEIGSHEAFFDQWWGYVETSPTRIRKPGDTAELARAFVAIVIDDLRADIHISNDVMKRVILAAAAARLDWRAALASAARVANRSTGGGSAQMREYLETFEQSNYFKDEVAKALRDAEQHAADFSPASGR
jgi:hypothetical protein